MGRLFGDIRGAVAHGSYVVSVHAVERLRVPRILEWQVASGLAEGALRGERPDTLPNPTVEVDQRLADGTPILAVWGWLSRSRLARLVTVHFYNGKR